MEQERIIRKYISMLDLKVHSDKSSSINVHCPICKEGNSPWKHRGYFMINDDGCVYYCFNCMNEGMSFYTFMKEYTPFFSSFQQEMKKLKIYDFKAKKNVEQNIEDIFKLSVKKEEKQEPFIELHKAPLNKKVLISDKYYSLEEIGENSTHYIKERGFTEEEIEQWKEKQTILYIPERNELFFPFYWEDEIYGFQTRAIDKKFFFNEVFETNPKIYGLYDILNRKVIKGDKLFVFESIFNMFSTNFDYKIAVLGKSIPYEILKILEEKGYEIIFCLDNDQPGRDMSIKMSSQGYRVVVHDKDFPVNDFNDALQMGIDKDTISKYILKQIELSPRLANMKLRTKGVI